MRVIKKCYGVALSIMLLASAENALALSCGSVSPERAVNGPNPMTNILVGVVVSTEFVENAGPNSPETIGELKIVETLRGSSDGSLRLEVTPESVAWGRPVAHVGRPYLVLQNSQNTEVFRIGDCTRPLFLDSKDVTVGDGCRLYKFRQLLNIDQPKSRACEVVNRRLSLPFSQRDTERGVFKEEFRRAKWRDLGVDWGG